MVKRIPKFTPRKKDKDLLTKLNRSLYAKERRLNIEFGKSMNFERKSLSDFSSRADFNEYVKQAKHNTNRNQHRYVKNAKGLVIPRSDYARAKRLDNKYQRRQKRALEKVRQKPMKSGGKNTDFTVGDFDNNATMGRPNLDHLKMPKFNFDNLENMREWELKQRTLENRGDKEYLDEKNKQFRGNYLRALEIVFGHDTGMDENDMGYQLYKHIKEMDIDDFITYWQTEFDVSIGFIYNSTQKALKLNHLHNIFGVEEINPDEWTFSEEDDFQDEGGWGSPTDYWL